MGVKRGGGLGWGGMFLKKGGISRRGDEKGRGLIHLSTLCPQGHHAFGKYLILFMIIYMMVKLGLVL